MATHRDTNATGPAPDAAGPLEKYLVSVGGSDRCDDRRRVNTVTASSVIKVGDLRAAVAAIRRLEAENAQLTDELARLRLAWRLLRDTVDAIGSEKAALSCEVTRLREERNALMVGYLAIATKSNIPQIEHMLDTDWKRAELVESVIKRVSESDQGKYLGLPSDLGSTP